MKGRNPTAKEKRHMDKVSQIGCIVCRNQGNDFVPSETMNGLWVSRHPWKKEFEKRYGTEQELLDQVKEILDAT